MLVLVDEYSRECLSIDVARRLSSDDVLERLAWLFVTRNVPQFLRSDNGSEFTAQAVRAWLAKVGVKTLFIEPGSPWENGYVESFNGKLRDELLDREIFYTLLEAKVLIERWRQHYNRIRPHSSLGYRPPAPEAIAMAAMTAHPCGGGSAPAPRLQNPSGKHRREGPQRCHQTEGWTNMDSGITSGGRSVPFDSELAEPMRRALSGGSGTVIGLDYRGEKVLAAYEQVGVVNWGVVGKIDLAEIRGVFLRAGLTAFSVGLVVVLIGAFIFLRRTDPLIRRLASNEARTRAILDTAADGVITIDEQGTIESFNAAAERIFGRNTTQSTWTATFARARRDWSARPSS
jgi:PAS domain-containing protein